MSHRIVSLIDMDCFYCQVESRINADLVGKPMAVVQYNSWKGGGIIAVNYEARGFGVTRQMRGDEAMKKCSEIILVKVPEVRGKADLTKYRDAGKEVIEVLLQFGGKVERASIDEAYIDISGLVEEEVEKLVSLDAKIDAEDLPNTFIVGHDRDSATFLKSVYDGSDLSIDDLRLAVGAKIVEKMRSEIFRQTKFRCSAGIAHNKMLAKFACGINKPNKQTILPQDQVPQLFTSVPIAKLRGLGGKLGLDVSMKLNCEHISDLAKISISDLRKIYDEKTAHWLFNVSRGIDTEEVKERDLPKSIGCSKNFRGPEMLDSKEKVEHWMTQLCEELTIRLNKDQEANKRIARGLTISVTQENTGHRTLSGPLSSYETPKVVRQAMELISKLNQSKDKQFWKPKLLNLSACASKFEESGAQGKNSSLATFLFGPKNSSSSFGSNLETTSNNLVDCGDDLQSDADKTEPSDLAKELFPGLWDPIPNLNYDQSLLDSVPYKLKTEIRHRLELLKNQKVDSVQGESEQEKTLPCNSNEMTEIEKQTGHRNLCLSNQSSSNAIEDDFEQCPKCTALVSPFSLPEHLDMHLAKELHKEIQQDLKRSIDLAKCDSKQNNIENKKRKHNSKTESNIKKQANITSFFIQK